MLKCSHLGNKTYILKNIPESLFTMENSAVLKSNTLFSNLIKTNTFFFLYLFCIFSSVQFSHSVVSNSLQPNETQHARPPCPSPTPGVHPNPCPLNRWCHPTISSTVFPSSPSLNLCQHQGLFKWVSSSHQVAKVLEFQLQHQSFQWTPRTDFL